MSKEMIIIFVYDTELIKREEDDPASAILYFHPTWVSDKQKTALCGQLMGVFRCLKDVLEAPSIVSLQSGKFSVKEYGRYIMATGTDRNIADWLLEHRANILHSLIKFYHSGIEDMEKIYKTSSNLSAKLYHMFETYQKVLFFGGNIFTYIPTLKLPKSASNVFLEAIHILQCCQEMKYVLGGTMLYHNKVVATQLSSELTKQIVLTDPYRIKSPAEASPVNFDLPLGVQLLEVYIPCYEYHRLHEEAMRSRSIFQYLINKSIKKVSKPVLAKEPVISAMKRDQSLLFTAVLEEDVDNSLNSNLDNPIIQHRPQNRPKFLNLKSKTTDVTENKENSKVAASTPYYSQPSVCSTPMTDLNKVVLQQPVSICTNVNETTTIKSTDECCENKSSDSESINSILSAVSNNSNISTHSKVNFNKAVPYTKITNNLYDIKKYSSMYDVREKLRSINESITMKYYNTDIINSIKYNNESSPKKEKKRCKSISDPTFPVERTNGKTISKYYYMDFMSEQIKLVKNEIKNQQNNISHKKENKLEDCDLKKFVKEVSSSDNNENIKQNIEIPELTSTDVKIKKDTNDFIKKNKEERRKSLTLPLKSLTSELDDKVITTAVPPRRYSMGVQLTPLMSKLSSLAFEERSSGFGSHDATPSDYRGFTPSQQSFPSSFKQKNVKETVKDGCCFDEKQLQKCCMFVFGQQDMVVAILLQDDVCTNQDVIVKMYDICSEYLGKLEKQLCHCLETYPGSGSSQSETEPYSYLCLDPEWDTLQRGGPWGANELGTLSYLHKDFSNSNNIVEILLRGSESVIYGYHLGDSEVFYHQSASSHAGMPTPADPMGLVPLKARRRLERDHAVILL